MAIKIATSIETEKWNSILKALKEQGWTVASQYPDLFDKGIDHDSYVLKKNCEKIEFGWTNWFEGEIKCSAERLTLLEKEFDTQFKFGEAEFLKLSSIDKIKNQLFRK